MSRYIAPPEGCRIGAPESKLSTPHSIDAILQQEREIRAALVNPDVKEIMVPRAFFKEQIGLRTIMCDQIGRIWDVSDNPIRMIFDPLFFTRKKKSNAR